MRRSLPSSRGTRKESTDLVQLADAPAHIASCVAQAFCRFGVREIGPTGGSGTERGPDVVLVGGSSALPLTVREVACAWPWADAEMSTRLVSSSASYLRGVSWRTSGYATL